MTASAKLPVYSLHQGTRPLLISIPHSGTALSADVAAAISNQARPLPDTDWFVDRLYEFARGLGCSVLRANYSRYVVDLNRPADGAVLYPGQNETEICPTTTFGGDPIYRCGNAPSSEQIAKRVEQFWLPYHRAIDKELMRLAQNSPAVCLWDGHSIRSHVPRFFDGQLPAINLGTIDGQSCDSNLRDQLSSIIQSSEYGFAIDGRFKGGYITRHYGKPAENVHAVQLEIAQRCYLDENSSMTHENFRPKNLAELLQKLVVSVLCFLENR